MPAYLIQHPAEQRREDILIEDPALTLTFDAGGLSSLTAKASASPYPQGKEPTSNG